MPDNIHLCLTDLLDQDLSSKEYFDTLPNAVRKELLIRDDITTFEELQEQAYRLKLNW
ncbi:MAG: hypothetical protein RSF82_06895 [Angelakisella sp.]